MSLKRSIKSKSRSLNLRQRDDNSLNSTELIMNEEIFEQNENELPENIDEYESFENISDSDSENIFENSSLLNSSFDGEFGPYFSSSTSASIFAWITKHMIFEYFTGEFVHIITSNHLNCMRITSIIFHNENVKLKLQRFLRFEELPDRFKTSERASNINTRWLLEDKPIIVDPRVLVNKTSVWLRDQQKLSYYSYEVDEILYRYENTWKIRNICYRIRHPSEYCSFPQNSKHESLKSFDDLSKELHYHQLMDREFEKILSSNSLTEQKVLCSELGLKNQKPVLDDLMFNRLLQTPHDIYHAIASKILRLMDFPKISNSRTSVIKSSTGNNDFIKTWKIFEMPIQWHKLPNPVTHRQSFMMSDRLRLAMILPHILRRFLKLKHLKQRSIDELQENLSVNSGLVINRLIQCWAIVAKCARFCFNLSFNDESYETLNSLLKQEIILLTKILVTTLWETDIIKTTFLDHYFLLDEEEINSPVDFICEIRYRIKWKYYEISQNNFEPNMSIDGDIYNGLKMAYKDYFNFLEYIHNKKIVYFNYITYKVLNDNDESSIIRIRVGDIVEIEEENEGTSYAIVKAIFLHTYNNDKTYPFYFVNWFEKVKERNGFDTLMTCQKYKICTEREKYLNIFPISLVTSMPKIHFVHQCVDNCLIESHDLSQPYLLNEFFYNAI
ncbi:7303_t:CDS:2 [Rhizophagus irregularis]|nr:7303_t:CDS:2 [Rhizophagus irregularis]